MKIVKNSFIKLSLVLGLAFSLFAFNTVTTPQVTHAQNLVCTVFPFLTSVPFARGVCGNTATEGQSAVSEGVTLVRLALQLVFVGIIIVSIYIIIRAALKYIRSEGDDTKIQEAQKAIKSVFVGIAALFIGVIGIVIILAFFQADVGGGDTDTIIQDRFPVT
jgi:hypothetical protein